MAFSPIPMDTWDPNSSFGWFCGLKGFVNFVLVGKLWVMCWGWFDFDCNFVPSMDIKTAINCTKWPSRDLGFESETVIEEDIQTSHCGGDGAGMWWGIEWEGGVGGFVKCSDLVLIMGLFLALVGIIRWLKLLGYCCYGVGCDWKWIGRRKGWERVGKGDKKRFLKKAENLTLKFTSKHPNPYQNFPINTISLISSPKPLSLPHLVRSHSSCLKFSFIKPWNSIIIQLCQNHIFAETVDYALNRRKWHFTTSHCPIMYSRYCPNARAL